MEITLTKDIQEIDSILEKSGKDEDLKGKGYSKPHFIPLFFSIKNDGEIIGYLYAYDINDGYFREVILDDVLIEEEFQGRGFGIKLVEELKRYCKSVGLSEISLKVLGTNFKGIKFYEKCGFVLDDLRFMKLEINCA